MSIPLPPINVSQYGKDTTADEIVHGVRMEDKVVIITGCTSGLGKETARAMAKTGAHVIITGRDMDKADAVVAELIASTGNERIESHWLDLSSFATVRESAEIFLARGLPLHLLILNAGVMACPYMKTVDGFELQFATNHLGHFLFTNLLIPLMRKSQPARVIVLSSAGHKRAGINWDDINFDLGYDKWIAYAQSKTANILFAKELTRRYQATGVSAFAVHPGGIMTELSRHLSQDEIRAFGWIDAEGKINSRFKSPQQGAATVVWAATTRDLKDRGGEYLEDCNISGNMEGMDPAQQRSIGYAGVAAHAQSMDDAIRLWELSEQWTGCPSAFSSRTTALEVVAGLDLTGRVAMITGAASGIGVETARALAQAGAHVIIAARDTDKAEAVVKSIKEATGNEKVEWMYLDLASFSMIREFVIHFESKDLPLHILINNAGIMATPQTHSDDGLEMQFATNHLGHFLLTNLLIPKLQASAPARVVVVSSVANRRGKIQWDDIHYNHTPYNKWHAYAQSKLANVLFMRELQRRYASVGISALAVHPGGIMTELQRSVAHEEQIAMGWIDGEGRQHPLFKSPQQGAATSTYAACHPDLEGLGGLYLEDCGISIGLTDIKWCGYGEQSLKMDDAARLWRVSERMCGMITGNDATPVTIPERTFTAKSTGEEVIRDIHLRSKVAIVTGATSGLGLETARCLAIAGAHVFVTGRNLHKLQMVVNDIIASTGNEQVEPMVLDLSSFASVREGVATFLAKKLPLHLLICNAATMANPHEKTVDGHEIQFAVNHLAHFLLVNLLLSTLQSSGGARVVVVASQAHKRSGIRWDDIHGDLKYDKYLYYAQSKTANILFMRELNRRYGASGITTHAVHPGGILTQLQRRMTREEMIKLGWMDANGKPHANFKSVEQGAATIVYAATAPELSGQSGEYLENCTITTHSTHPYSGVAEHALNTAEATKLWEYSERVTGAGSVEWY